MRVYRARMLAICCVLLWPRVDVGVRSVPGCPGRVLVRGSARCESMWESVFCWRIWWVRLLGVGMLVGGASCRVGGTRGAGAWLVCSRGHVAVMSASGVPTLQHAPVCHPLALSTLAVPYVPCPICVLIWCVCGVRVRRLRSMRRVLVVSYVGVGATVCLGVYLVQCVCHVRLSPGHRASRRRAHGQGHITRY